MRTPAAHLGLSFLMVSIASGMTYPHPTPPSAQEPDAPGWDWVDTDHETSPPAAELVSLRRIWDQAAHQAFTGLVRFQDHWYCAFREGTAHRSPDGRLRVLRSPDGKTWESVALMQGEEEGDDLRDARLTITADRQLMLNGAVTHKGDAERTRQSLTWLSDDGSAWSGPHACPTGYDTWRWSVTWHESYGYSIGYTGKDRQGTLYRTSDGMAWETVAENLFPQAEKGRGNEAHLAFHPNGTAYCLLRRDSLARDWGPDAADTSALLGTAQPPYTSWAWKDLGVRMGGPVLLRLQDGRHVTAVRLYGPARTVLMEIDVERGAATKWMTLPSGGDTSYAGLVEHDGLLWISYYSSHEEKTSIYLAQVRIPERKSIYVPNRTEPRVGIENVCAWPELIQTGDGTLGVSIHNQPSHLRMPGDVAYWASEDGGRTWTERGVPAPRDTEKAARGHMALGQAPDGDLIAVTTGWSGPFDGDGRGTITPTWISRSRDGGRNWSIDRESFPSAPNGRPAIPYGNIVTGSDGVLLLAAYSGGVAYVYRSTDGGRTWEEPAALDEERSINETSLLHLGKGRLLAAARTGPGHLGMMLYASEDNGRTWTFQRPLTDPEQHPGHLTRLADGRLLLTHGNRQHANPHVPPAYHPVTPASRGLDARFSADEGHSWIGPYRIMDFEGDGGYPSSTQLPDGRILTVYYARRVAGYDHYHMGAMLWTLPEAGFADPARNPAE